MNSALRPQPQDDQSPVLGRWVSSGIREPEIQGEQGTALGATDLSDTLVVCTSQPLFEHRARVVPVGPE